MRDSRKFALWSTIAIAVLPSYTQAAVRSAGFTGVLRVAQIQFKSEQVRREYADHRVPPLLRRIVGFVAAVVPEPYDVLITDVWRSREETRRIYGRYKHSPHHHWRAVDLVLVGPDGGRAGDDVYTHVKARVGDAFSGLRPLWWPFPICIYHDVGRGKHLHLQVWRGAK